MKPASKIDENRPPKRAKTGGRKKGTPNAATAAVRAAIEAADPIAFLIDVMGGKVSTQDPNASDEIAIETPSSAERIRAAEFLAKRIAPEAKEQPIAFDLPIIDSPSDAVRAMSGVAMALAAGQILPREARALNDALAHYLKAFELVEVSERLDALEAAIAKEGRSCLASIAA